MAMSAAPKTMPVGRLARRKCAWELFVRANRLVKAKTYMELFKLVEMKVQSNDGIAACYSLR
jgi:hypothetical protein